MLIQNTLSLKPNLARLDRSKKKKAFCIMSKMKNLGQKSLPYAAVNFTFTAPQRKLFSQITSLAEALTLCACQLTRQ